jgi:ATP-binding protein involved in chromosome partitioning
MGLLDRIQFKPPSGGPPDAIDVGEGGEIVIQWPGERRVAIPAAKLRDACPCAGCIEEGTGLKLLDPATIPADIRPLQVVAVGNYAVQIFWSDGHSTGIYTWETLRRASGI